MPRRRILWQLYPTYLLITIIAVIAVAWFASNSFRRLYLQRIVSDLEVRAVLVQPLVEDYLNPPDTGYLNAICTQLEQRTGSRITVVAVDGKIVGHALDHPFPSEDLSGLAEFSEALAGRTGVAERLDLSDRAEHLFVAAPVMRDGAVLGVVRMSYPMAAVSDTLRGLRLTIGIAGLIVAILAAILSLVVSRRISRPIEEMKRGAERFARGELDYKLPVPDSEEIGSLAQAMNHMAEQLHERIRTALKQRGEQEAILASMVEGILVVDAEEQVLDVNQAAAELFDIDREAARGQLLQQDVRIPALQKFIARVFEIGKPITEDVVIYQGQERFLQAHGNILRDDAGQVIGALVVLHDMTQMRRLESVRRDFVANVSHELKTPITSIKGYVETLLDGPSSPEDTQKFLGIIMKQADRLNAIIDDLLSLSRIEQGVERADIVLETGSIASVLRNSIHAVEKAAQTKSITLQVSCEDHVQARINAPLLEQAVVNLVDNAVKYSAEGGTVTISGSQTLHETIITVTDTGRGIAKEHLPRIFERFFRVDKSRSRDAGGTGLGLAIVKHIVLAHGGTITVDSVLGQGSTFEIHLPKKRPGGRFAEPVLA